MYKTMSFPLLLRGFVVLGVMLMHTTWYFSHAHAESWVTISEMLLDIISLFAVPLVMFVSGYMFISHNRHADYYKWSFFRRMFLSVLSPYLLFSLLYLGGAWFFSNASFTLKQVAYLIITGSSARNRDSGAAATAAHPGMPSPARPSRYCEVLSVPPAQKVAG